MEDCNVGVMGFGFSRRTEFQGWLIPLFFSGYVNMTSRIMASFTHFPTHPHSLNMYLSLGQMHKGKCGKTRTTKPGDVSQMLTFHPNNHLSLAGASEGAGHNALNGQNERCGLWSPGTQSFIYHLLFFMFHRFYSSISMRVSLLCIPCCS